MKNDISNDRKDNDNSAFKNTTQVIEKVGNLNTEQSDQDKTPISISRTIIEDSKIKNDGSPNISQSNMSNTAAQLQGDK